MAPTHLDYDPSYVAAARSVLLEVAHVLAGYREQTVLVGGWVPGLILPGHPLRHVGSLDVDLALDHRALQEPVYKTIERLLCERGYTPGAQPFIFWRTVQVGEQAIRVEVDLLAGEYEGTGRSHRTQRIQGVRARKARGCDLAFDLNTVVAMEGRLPNGAQDTATLRVASVVPFVVMKAIALRDRLKEKDAWDIYFCLRNYPRGLGALAEEFLPHVRHGLVREGLQALHAAFASREQVGPHLVADFEDPTDVEERAFLERDACERVQELLKGLAGAG